MNESFPVMYLVRHGETAWSLNGRHTGLPLTEQGECKARRLGQRLSRIQFGKVMSSPLQRAMRTCEVAGFGGVTEVDPNLVEWNYGDYEGLRTAEIREKRPGWQLFRDGCPGGESPEQVGIRADRIVGRLRESKSNVLLFSSGHFLRVLTARWLGLEPSAGRYFLLRTASLSALGYDNDWSLPAIDLWNDTGCTEDTANSGQSNSPP
jgi:probable phosphoglycerate mutase